MAYKKRQDSNRKTLRNNEFVRGDGYYAFRYKDNSGKKKTVYAKTLKELREKEDKILKDLEDGIKTAIADKTTLNQLFQKYMEYKVDIRANTRENYLLMWRNNVQHSFLGDMKISDIKPLHIKKLYKGFSERGLSLNTIKLIHNLLVPCFQEAVVNDVLRKNPVVAVDYSEFSSIEKEKTALTAEQQNKLLDFVRNNNTYCVYLPFLVVALKTGCRVGELTGLTWNDVDLKQNNLDINHQLQYLKLDGKTEFHISPLKTKAGKRDLPIDLELRKAFMEQKKIHLLQGITSKANIDGYTDFVFVTKTGKPYATNAVNFFLSNIVKTYNRQEETAAQEENRTPEPLPHISAHILRHTACTRMAEAGVDIKVLQTVMGHSSIDVTMNIYNHANDSARIEKEMKKTEKIILYG